MKPRCCVNCLGRYWPGETSHPQLCAICDALTAAGRILRRDEIEERFSEVESRA